MTTNGIKTDIPNAYYILFTMNIYSALRSRHPHQRVHLINQVRRYINDDGFAGILESIEVENLESIRQGCRALNVYMNVPHIRPRVQAWLKGY